MSRLRPLIEDEHDCAGASSSQATWQMDRRRMLVGGFALAASGLVVPALLIAETAADHPIRGTQRRADKRRDRKHHRLKQKRKRQRRQQSPAGSLRAEPNVLRLSLVNATDMTDLASLRTATGEWNDQNRTQLDIRANSTLGPYETADPRVAVSFFNDVYRPFLWLERLNGAVTTTWHSGGLLTPQGYSGGTTYVDHLALEPGDAVTKVVRFDEHEDGTESYRVTVSREKNVPEAMVFTMIFTNP